MKVVVLDESKKRTEQIVEILQKKRYTFVCCTQSGQFMETLQESLPDKIIIDYDAWLHGRMIYNHFNLSKRIENVPVVFYNAPENFVALNNRKRHDSDRILNKTTDSDAFLKMLMEL
jgi:PleD family two-component response regulator